MHLRFTSIIDNLFSLGKTFTGVDLVDKFLRCLSREWLPKVTTIVESRDFKNLDLPTLIKRLKEHEPHPKCLKESEATMCLMAKLDPPLQVDDDEVSDSSSEYDEPSSNDLRAVFNELYHESNNLAKGLSIQKKMVLTLVVKVASL